jgi:hypothetical protein
MLRGGEIKMNRKITFIVMFLLIPVSIVVAQQKDANIILITNPTGATIYLNGEYNLVASSPASLPSNLSGHYNLRVVRSGYEPWRGEMTFIPGTPNDINIKLTRKTRFKAGLRSLLVPGWGQYYSGNNFRGGMFTLGVISSAAGLYFADKKYQDKRSLYDIAAQQYFDAGSISERLRLKGVMDSAQRIAYKAETDRRALFLVGVGLWTYNIIDALIFFPEGEAYYPTVSAIDGGAKLTFVARF